MKRLLQKSWQNKIVTPVMLKDLMDKIKTQNLVRDKALFAFLYLTGARVQEVVRYNSKQQPWPSTEGIRKNQVNIDEVDPRTVTVYNVRCLKRMMQRYKKTEKIVDGTIVTERTPHKTLLPPTYRNIAIHVNTAEQPFWDVLKTHLDRLDKDDELFPLSPQRARKCILKAGIHPHALRHQRFTHFVDL
jgi:integrase